jgi:hypothetical protein
VSYAQLCVVILKHGGSNLLYIASTVMVPINNLAFSLRFVPGHQPLKPTDLVGLAVIMAGPLPYRYCPLQPLRSTRYRWL